MHPLLYPSKERIRSHAKWALQLTTSVAILGAVFEAMIQSLWVLLIPPHDLVIDIWYFKVWILSETYHFFISANSKLSGIW